MAGFLQLIFGIFAVCLLLGLRGSPEATKLHSPCISSLSCQLDRPGIHSKCLFLGFPTLSFACSCQHYAVEMDGVCRKSAEKVGDECVGNVQCLAVGGVEFEWHLEGTACFEGKCSCVDGFIPNEDGTRCVPPKKLGEQCKTRMECYGGSWRDCIEGICVCVNRQKPSEDGKDCIFDVRGDHCPVSCKEHSECQNGCGGLSHCEDISGTRRKSCECEEGAIFVNGNCTIVNEKGLTF